MNKVKEFFQKYGQEILWIKELLPKCKQAVLYVTAFFQKCGQVTLCIPAFLQKHGQVILWFILIFLFLSFISVMFLNSAESLFGNLLGTIESKQETLKFIGFAMGGILAALGAIAVNRRANAQVENNKLIEKGHVDERFKAAVEHLGEDKTEIAAYYEFYSLAKRHENLRESIFNILCGRLRKVTTSKDYKTNHPDNPSENMQTLLDILFKSKDGNVFDKLSANLPQTHLVGAYLNEAHLREATFFKVNLQNATFSGTNLRNARFSGAKLRNVSFWRADLQNTIFLEPNLQDASFRDAILRNAKFVKANLQNAIFWYANLQNAIFSKANLQNADFSYASLQNARFSETNLQNASFQNASFLETHLQGADLSSAKNLTSEMIKSAIIDEKTQLPEGVTHPSRKEAP